MEVRKSALIQFHMIQYLEGKLTIMFSLTLGPNPEFYPIGMGTYFLKVKQQSVKLTTHLNQYNAEI
jgi:hypothetical protein